MRTAWASLAIACLLAPAARAQERQLSLEHAGSVGLLVGTGPIYGTLVEARCPSCAGDRLISGFSGALDLGATLAVGEEGSELVGRLRLTRLSDASGEALLAGYRRSFGREEWKSYFELDLEGILRPARLLGPRAALGAMLDLSPIFGLYAEAGLAVDLGGGRRVGVDFTVGLHARSFLLQ